MVCFSLLIIIINKNLRKKSFFKYLCVCVDGMVCIVYCLLATNEHKTVITKLCEKDTTENTIQYSCMYELHTNYINYHPLG